MKLNSSTTSRALVKSVAGSEYDFEWYPTTQEIIECVKNDMGEFFSFRNASVLDCGAGDGRVLQSLTDGNKYAIEISRPLLDSYPRDIFIVGTDFNQQTLLDKNCDVCFSNPPYSDFENWATKIITEANSAFVYLVLPTRWENSLLIKHAIDSRRAKAEILDTFDFLSADRSARAVVNVLRVDVGWSHHHRSGPNTDPFEIWFDQYFSINAAPSSSSSHQYETAAKASMLDRLQGELVEGSDLISVLERLYLHDMDNLIKTYKAIETIDASLLAEMDVNVGAVRGALKQKIEGLKDRYWNELFENLEKITSRLTSSSRKALLDTLTSHTHVDFSSSNAYAIVVWAIKNSNHYFNEQLVGIVKSMTEKANIVLYKSNKKTFGDERWRYCSTPEDLDQYGLDYRIVLHRSGGLCTAEYSYDKGPNGLSMRAATFLNDLVTVAGNLSFNCKSTPSAGSFLWDTHVRNEFVAVDVKTGDSYVLFDAKAFKNGNLHIRLNRSFIARLNVEFGRLEGWLKSPKQASDELEIDIKEALYAFESNKQLDSNSLPMLTNVRAA